MPKLGSLSGVWGGKYWYPAYHLTLVPFSAWLTSNETIISGTSLEPNALSIDGPEEISGEIEGRVESDRVSFCKTFPGLLHSPVFYQGRISDDRNQIIGEWKLHDGGFISGDFEMSRMHVVGFTR